MKKRLTCKDLVFVETYPGHYEATVSFPNGYRFICRKGRGTSTTIGSPYEIQIVPPVPESHPYLSNEITGYNSEEQVNVSLQECANLKKIETHHEEVTNFPKPDW